MPARRQWAKSTPLRNGWEVRQSGLPPEIVLHNIQTADRLPGFVSGLYWGGFGCWL